MSNSIYYPFRNCIGSIGRFTLESCPQFSLLGFGERPTLVCVLLKYLHPADGPRSERLDGGVALALKGRMNPSYRGDFHGCTSY